MRTKQPCRSAEQVSMLFAPQARYHSLSLYLLSGVKKPSAPEDDLDSSKLPQLCIGHHCFQPRTRLMQVANSILKKGR